MGTRFPGISSSVSHVLALKHFGLSLNTTFQVYSLYFYILFLLIWRVLSAKSNYEHVFLIWMSHINNITLKYSAGTNNTYIFWRQLQQKVTNSFFYCLSILERGWPEHNARLLKIALKDFRVKCYVLFEYVKELLCWRQVCKI